jgi:hypothetical protein
MRTARPQRGRLVVSPGLRLSLPLGR